MGAGTAQSVLWAGRRRKRGLIPGRSKEIFLLSTASRPVLWPTQPPTESLPGPVSPQVKLQEPEAYHPTPSCVEVKNSGATRIFPLTHRSSW
jgi:hypothetical protein